MVRLVDKKKGSGGISIPVVIGFALNRVKGQTERKTVRMNAVYKGGNSRVQEGYE